MRLYLVPTMAKLVEAYDYLDFLKLRGQYSGVVHAP
jgi:hypothetical protein